MGADWRLWALGGLAFGLALSSLAPGRAPATTELVGLLACLLLGWRRLGRARAVALAALALLAGLVLGAARIAALEGAALRARSGTTTTASGHVFAPLRAGPGIARVPLATPRGRVLLEVPGEAPALAVGAGARATGTLQEPSPFLRDALRRQGIATVLHTRRIEPTGTRRGGLSGHLDAIRDRASEALGRGAPEREAALARGFVLGQDDRIDAETIESFRRSGLSHLLAVSGQNVLLLVLLATPLLAALSIPLRARLIWLLGLIALYVPLAGAGPSIQRAGVMGAAALLAMVAGRPASRLYALLGAAAMTLAINPLAAGDPGWQLSFAAVAGIFLLVAPLRALVAERIGGGPWQGALAEGVAVTVAASLATAPLVIHHFEALPLGSLAANLVALPAVAPAMWLGMIAAALAQLPGVPVEPVNWLNSLLLAYIAQVALWLGGPSWAVVTLRLEGPAAIAAAYLGLGAITAAALRLAARRRFARARRTSSRGLRGLAVTSALVLLGLGMAALERDRGGAARAAPDRGLRVDFIDVGQGDAIALQPADGPAVLVDGGPRGEDLAAKLREAGIESLGAVIVSHDQADHSGGIAEILGSVPVGRLVYASASPSLLALARTEGVRPLRVGQGGRLRSGSLWLDVLWPPPEAVHAGADPNAGSIVLLARWRGFAILLTGDAEAEVAPLAPGPIDVLKVAHHGSEDTGLAALLRRVSPELAVISVGSGNPFGHPAAATLRTLEQAGVEVLRTDREGTVALHMGEGAITVGN